MQNVTWPAGRRFAFTVYDDTDLATVQNVGSVYEFLADCGFRTTKSCWTLRGDPNRGKNQGQTLEDPEYRLWLLALVSKGFMVDWHGATWHGTKREDVNAALEFFAKTFDRYPAITANHADAEDGLYWGSNRLTSWRRFLYKMLTLYRNEGRYRGHIEGDEYFWGDLCHRRIKYCRNFVFQDISTLKACPMMPYHDLTKPYVNYWFASSNGFDVKTFNRCISEARQDRLEAEGGACIMYTHFALGFYGANGLNAHFTRLMRRLSKKNGWFVPCAQLLDHLLEVKGHHDITAVERRWLEAKWLAEKVFVGRT